MSPEVLILTTREVADRFRVSPSTVRRWAEKGELRYAAKLPGGEYRFEKNVVDTMFELATPTTSDTDPTAPTDSTPVEPVGAFSRSEGTKS